MRRRIRWWEEEEVEEVEVKEVELEPAASRTSQSWCPVSRQPGPKSTVLYYTV